MHSVYNPWLVSLSIVVAILVSFTSLRLASRVAESRSSAGVIWLVFGAISMGIGIWAMHFIGMLAFSLPIQLRYSMPLTFASLGAAILTSGFAIKIASSSHLGLGRHIACSVVMGLGIVIMHYTGMRAILIFPAISYSAPLVAGSVGIAILASFAALWLTFNLRSGTHRFIWAARLGAAVIMGLAISGMHYTGMSAAHFMPDAFCSGGVALDSQWLGVSVGLASLALLTITLVTGIFDARLAERARAHMRRMEALNQQLAHEAVHDPLTGLPSRALFIQKLQQAISACDHGGRADSLVSVMLVDLDRFKVVNDSLGHDAGDDLLKEVARRLGLLVGKSGFLARLGADEFLVLAEVADTSEISGLAAKILRSLGQPYPINNVDVHPATSIGITTYPFDQSTPDVLISHADEAMHDMKRDGGSGFRFFVPGTTAFTMDRLRLESDLRYAADRGEMELHYQPQLDIANGTISGLEALVRWRHPRRGWISPGEFIPLAESTDLIVGLGSWILQEACRQARAWLDEGIVDICIAVNLSARQFRQPDLLMTIQQALAEQQLPARHIVIELTESAVMSDPDRSVQVLEELCRLGFQVAVDDFGTGYSSLNYLKQLPVGKLKIDQSFIRELGASSRNDAIVKATIHLAHGLGMTVVAEGVETPAQLAFLETIGCDQYQGYLYRQPLDAGATGVLLRNHRQRRHKEIARVCDIA